MHLLLTVETVDNLNLLLNTSQGGLMHNSRQRLPTILPTNISEEIDLLSDSFALLALTGALIVTMASIYIYIQGHFFRFSLSPLMQLMLQVSL